MPESLNMRLDWERFGVLNRSKQAAFLLLLLKQKIFECSFRKLKSFCVTARQSVVTRSYHHQRTPLPSSTSHLSLSL